MKRFWNKLRTALKKRERIFIVPSFFGFSLSLVLLGTIIAAALFGRFEVIVLPLVLILISLLMMFQSNSNLAKISVDAIKNQVFEEGVEASLKLILSNVSNDIKYNICITPTSKKFSDAQSTVIDSIPSMRKEVIEIKCVPVEAGVLRELRIRVSSYAPMGLFYTWRLYNLDLSLYIYPKSFNHLWSQSFDFQKLGADQSKEESASAPQFENNNTFSQSWENSFDSSNALALQAQSNLEFREYVPTTLSDQAQIDWKMFAKSRKPYKKTFDVRSSGQTDRVFDFLSLESLKSFAPNTKQALEQLCFYADQAIRHRRNLIIAIGSDEYFINQHKVSFFQQRLAEEAQKGDV